jgi:hypothetical protein
MPASLFVAAVATRRTDLAPDLKCQEGKCVKPFPWSVMLG